MWPTLVYEVMSGLDRLWSDVEQNHIEPSSVQVHLSVCKLVEMMLKLSSLELPQFQLYVKCLFCVCVRACVRAFVRACVFVLQ